MKNLHRAFCLAIACLGFVGCGSEYGKQTHPANYNSDTTSIYHDINVTGDFLVGSYLGETDRGRVCDVTIRVNGQFDTYVVSTSLMAGREFVVSRNGSRELNSVSNEYVRAPDVTLKLRNEQPTAEMFNVISPNFEVLKCHNLHRIGSDNSRNYLYQTID